MPYRDTPKFQAPPWISRFEDSLKDYRWYRKKIGGSWVRLRYYSLGPSTIWWQRGEYTDPVDNPDFPFGGPYKIDEENWPCQ